ncbi:MAG: nucleotidyltransferase domain-containing protein, partial [Candidatus Omnitrophica bacterium]|nr:nucleotidyltransferase domain-containing protein [Candidatus Omnitrophota bacterium]
FFANPDREYYLREIEKATGYSVGNIRREMLKLGNDGLFLRRTHGNLAFYKLNTSYPLYGELRNIVHKTVGIERFLHSALKNEDGILFAFIYGSFAKAAERSSSDIDIIVIGKVEAKKVKSRLFECQNSIAREINSTIYSPDEFLAKLKDKNHFISSVVKGKKAFFIGDESEFRRFIQIRKIGKA